MYALTLLGELLVQVLDVEGLVGQRIPHFGNGQGYKVFDCTCCTTLIMIHISYRPAKLS